MRREQQFSDAFRSLGIAANKISEVGANESNGAQD